MTYRITGLDAAPFRPLFGLSDVELFRRGVHRVVVREAHSAPDRIELRDAEPGESVLLLNHVYLDVNSPYRGAHAIYVREWAETTFDGVDQIPDSLQRRLISLRAFDADGMMVDADVIDGAALAGLIGRFFDRQDVAFLHAHHARRGCYAARVERA